uniref:(northern house mosquito) hypothetical protein n=1 Tax=Culex pipiens TaxID=7175 RepID=A0A8D7ZXL7_CULPI
MAQLPPGQYLFQQMAGETVQRWRPIAVGWHQASPPPNPLVHRLRIVPLEHHQLDVRRYVRIVRKDPVQSFGVDVVNLQVVAVEQPQEACLFAGHQLLVEHAELGLPAPRQHLRHPNLTPERSVAQDVRYALPVQNLVNPIKQLLQLVPVRFGQVAGVQEPLLYPGGTGAIVM